MDYPVREDEVPSPVNSEPSPQARPKRAVFARVRWQVLDWLGRVSGDRIARPMAREILQHQRPRDPEENEAFTPADDSHIEVEGVWACEVFTPSNIERALRQMKRRGWANSFKRGSERDLVGWLRSRRREGGTGSHNVQFTRPEDRSFFTIGHDAELPTFASTAVAQVRAITPSISGFLVLFVLRTSERSRIEQALRATYVSTVISEGRAAVTVDPELARRRAVEGIREGWRREISTWIGRHAPGVFWEDDRQDLPTCELLIGENFPLFEPIAEGARRDPIASIIDATFSRSLFEEEADPTLTFATNPCRAEVLDSHSILGGPRQALEGTVHQLNRTAGERRHLYGAHENFQEIFVNWTLLQLARVYRRRINETRDQAARLLASVWPLGTLKRLQRLTTTLSDTAVVGRELDTLARSGFFNSGTGYDLRLRRWRPREKQETYAGVVARSLAREAAALSEASAELNAFVAAQANLISARANLWLQVIVFGFALIGLAFGAISALEAGSNLLRAWSNS